MLSYDKLAHGIDQASGTMLPALFVVVAERCAREGCFVADGMARIVANIEQRISSENCGSGPHGTQQTKPKIIGLTCGKCGARYQLFESTIHRRCGLNGCDGYLHFIGQ